MKKIRVAINGYGVIGKRVADAVTLQNDMEMVGICDIITDWRINTAVQKGYPVFAFNDDYKKQIMEAGVPVEGVFSDIIKKADIIVDCTPEKIAAQNIKKYKESNTRKALQQTIL